MSRSQPSGHELRTSAFRGDAQYVRTLLLNGADVNAANPTNGETALHKAVKGNKVNVIDVVRFDSLSATFCSMFGHYLFGVCSLSAHFLLALGSRVAHFGRTAAAARRGSKRGDDRWLHAAPLLYRPRRCADPAGGRCRPCPERAGRVPCHRRPEGDL